MGQKSDKLVKSEPSTDGEMNKGFWRRITDDLLGRDVTSEFQKNRFCDTFSDPLFPMFLGSESNNDWRVSGELDGDLDIQLEYDQNPSVFDHGVNGGSRWAGRLLGSAGRYPQTLIDGRMRNANRNLCWPRMPGSILSPSRLLGQTAFLVAAFAKPSVQDDLKVEGPADGLQSPEHSRSDDDIQSPNGPRSRLDDGRDQIQPLPLILLNHEKVEDKNPKLRLQVKVNGRWYEIHKVLGRGGFGAVYQGVREQDGLKVALKIVEKTQHVIRNYIKIPGCPEPLPREVGLHLLATRGGSAPLFVKLLDWQDYSDCIVMVLELPSPCEDVLDFLNHNGGSLTEDVAQTILVQAINASEICCKRGVFHRDIKLSNLLINPNTLEVKLIDFGSGDLLKTSPYKEFIGTLSYTCPENLKTGKYHAKPATVYSLGVMLFIMVCGKYPNSTDLQQIYGKTWSKNGLTKECCDLIQACMDPNPDKRIHLDNMLGHPWFKTPGTDKGDQHIEQQNPVEINGHQCKIDKMVDKGAANEFRTRVKDGLKVALKVVWKGVGLYQSYLGVYNSYV